MKNKGESYKLHSLIHSPLYNTLNDLQNVHNQQQELDYIPQHYMPLNENKVLKGIHPKVVDFSFFSSLRSYSSSTLFFVRQLKIVINCFKGYTFELQVSQSLFMSLIASTDTFEPLRITLSHLRCFHKQKIMYLSPMQNTSLQS